MVNHYFSSASFNMDCMFVSFNDFSEIVDTRNGKPQSFPNATDVPLKFHHHFILMSFIFTSLYFIEIKMINYFNRVFFLVGCI